MPCLQEVWIPFTSVDRKPEETLGLWEVKTSACVSLLQGSALAPTVILHTYWIWGQRQSVATQREWFFQKRLAWPPKPNREASASIRCLIQTCCLELPVSFNQIYHISPCQKQGADPAALRNLLNLYTRLQSTRLLLYQKLYKSLHKFWQPSIHIP